MNVFRTAATAMALVCAFSVLPAVAQEEVSNVSGDPTYVVSAPPFYSMIGDLLIARPLLIGATVVGAAAFVVTLPFSAAGGNIGEAGKALVLDPGKAAFVRCLGCTTSGYKKD
ncbi:multidrug transporter [Pseudomonas sp. T]|nr:multidrug transporter [Pseudomonas sp. T]